MGLDTYLKLKEVPANIARVIICYDALLQLRQKKIKPTRGTYIKTKIKLNQSLQVDKALEKQSCEACALGSLFVARATVFNNLKISEVYTPYCGPGLEISANKLSSELDKYFSKEQLGLIEVAFETHSRGLRGTWVYGEKAVAAITFGKRYQNTTSRLVAILKNIIKNDGTFCPEQLPKSRKKKA